jgi:hypothetical protein
MCKLAKVEGLETRTTEITSVCSSNMQISLVPLVMEIGYTVNISIPRLKLS